MNNEQQPPDRRPRPLQETSLYSLLRHGRQAANVPAVPVDPPPRLLLPRPPNGVAPRRSPVERREELVEAIDNVLTASDDDLIPADLARAVDPQEPPPGMQEETSVSNEDSTTSLVHEAAVAVHSNQLPSARPSRQPREQ